MDGAINSIFTLILCIGVVFVLLLLIGFYIVEQQTAAVIERFGKFNKISKSGLNWRIPFIDRIAGRISLRVLQLDVAVETKTKDNVFVKIIVAVQYYVLPAKVYEAFYSLDNPEAQIKSFVFDTVRARVPNIVLDDVFEKKDEIADAVKTELSETMGQFGYGIIKTLVTDIDPDEMVKASMNEINAAQRQKVAAIEKGEANKILQVKEAEAEAESKALQGKGVADQRKAIIEGLRESVSEFKKSIDGTSAQDVMNLVLITQYLDALKDIGSVSQTNTILLPHSPGTLNDLIDQVRSAIISGQEAVNKTGNK